MMLPRLATPRVDPYNCFPGQDPSERAVIFARHHWLFTLAVFLRYIVWLVIPLIITAVLAALDVRMQPQTGNLLLFLACWYAMILTALYFVRWLRAYYDYVVITTERIVDVDQIGLFEHTTSETSLSEIQDVSHHIRGFWGSVFGYGDLKIQTAGEKGLFEMKNLAKPAEIRSQVLVLRDSFVERQQAHAFQDALGKRTDV